MQNSRCGAGESREGECVKCALRGVEKEIRENRGQPPAACSSCSVYFLYYTLVELSNVDTLRDWNSPMAEFYYLFCLIRDYDWNAPFRNDIINNFKFLYVPFINLKLSMMSFLTLIPYSIVFSITAFLIKYRSRRVVAHIPSTKRKQSSVNLRLKLVCVRRRHELEMRLPLRLLRFLNLFSYLT